MGGLVVIFGQITLKITLWCKESACEFPKGLLHAQKLTYGWGYLRHVSLTYKIMP